MRLWHVDLIPVLPRRQLLEQWRDLNSIFKNQPNHILINWIYDYPKDHLYSYSLLVMEEMSRRGYRYNTENFEKYFGRDIIRITNVFPEQMTKHYLSECFSRIMEDLHNDLNEKHDCGGISYEEFQKITDLYLEDIPREVNKRRKRK